MTVLVSEENITAEMMRPLNKRCVIQKAILPEKTKGGIVRAEAYRDLSQTAIVVRVASDVQDVAVGDQILFSMYAARPCFGSVETDLLFIREPDILAVIVTS